MVRLRHYALRYHRVRDQADRICFCPTNLMKADGLTKLDCSVAQRSLVLHNVVPIFPDEINSDDEDEDSQLNSEVEAKLALAWFAQPFRLSW